MPSREGRKPQGKRVGVWGNRLFNYLRTSPTSCGLTDDEVAFYDALEVNDSAVAVLGDETLQTIAQELVRAVRSSITIDWTVRENVRAQMRVIVKRILRKYGYPPDRQARATELVLEQAEVLCKDWVE